MTTTLWGHSSLAFCLPLPLPLREDPRTLMACRTTCSGKPTRIVANGMCDIERVLTKPVSARSSLLAVLFCRFMKTALAGSRCPRLSPRSYAIRGYGHDARLTSPSAAELLVTLVRGPTPMLFVPTSCDVPESPGLVVLQPRE